MLVLPMLLQDARRLVTIALYGTASSVCASLAQLAVGRIADRSGWKASNDVNFAALAAGSFAIAAVPDRLWVVFAGATVGMSAWSLSTLVPVQLTKAVGASEQGRALGFMHLFWNLAMILAGLTGGVLFEAWNGLPLLVGGIAAAAGLPIAVGFARMTGSEASRARTVNASRRLRSGGRGAA
jgi:MFS family permease